MMENRFLKYWEDTKSFIADVKLFTGDIAIGWGAWMTAEFFWQEAMHIISGFIIAVGSGIFLFWAQKTFMIPIIEWTNLKIAEWLNRNKKQ